jgi:hypothetical protein
MSFGRINDDERCVRVLDVITRIMIHLILRRLCIFDRPSQ